MYTLKEINGKLRNGSFTERNVAMAILTDYADAEEQGLIIKLPCKVGDTVYFIKSMFSFSESPMEGTVCMIKTFSSNGTFTFGVIMDSNHQERSFTNSDIGKTVFLTKEAAEAALKGSV